MLSLAPGYADHFHTGKDKVRTYEHHGKEGINTASFFLLYSFNIYHSFTLLIYTILCQIGKGVAKMSPS